MKKIKMSLSRMYIYILSQARNISHSINNWHLTRLNNLNKRTSFILCVVGISIAVGYVTLLRPVANFPLDRYITIVNGSDLTTVSTSLEKSGVIRNAKILALTVQFLGGSRTVRAGDYLFARPIGTFEIARAITTGSYGLNPISITIPEGTTVVEMADIYKKKLFKFDAQKFIKIALPYEGYLYPDTYNFLPNVRAYEVLKSMNENFRTHIVDFVNQVDASPYTLHQIITLASIIQKEAWKRKDQKSISGVLYNRLKKGMRLQVDATFTYTHNKGTSQITIADLTDKNNPYNTYTHKGLPPGPIGAVGSSSISAALNPTSSNYLYYLADKNGTTHFSTTYKQHLVKKKRYIGGGN